MPRPTTLPPNALQHLPQQALDHIPPDLLPEPNLVRDNPAISFEGLSGTSGQADIFIFDMAAILQNGVTQPGGTGYDGYVLIGSFEAIYGFEYGLDRVAVVNLPIEHSAGGGLFPESDLTNIVPTNNDPNKPDTFTIVAQFGSQNALPYEAGAFIYFVDPIGTYVNDAVDIYPNDPFLL